MAKFYNCTDKYLWKNGIGRFLIWVYIFLAGYILFFILHKPVVNIQNSFITITWGIGTLWLLIYWGIKGDRFLELLHSWVIGYMGEWLVKRELINLPDDYIVFYDLRLFGKKGNIDFVVVCTYGVFAVEVKFSNSRIYSIFNKWQKRWLAQAKIQAGGLQLELQNMGVKWVKPILVFARQKRYHEMINEGVDVLGRGSIKWYFEDYILKKTRNNYTNEKILQIENVIKKIAIKAPQKPSLLIAKNHTILSLLTNEKKSKDFYL